jgi:hypothetical protein
MQARLSDGETFNNQLSAFNVERNATATAPLKV